MEVVSIPEVISNFLSEIFVLDLPTPSTSIDLQHIYQRYYKQNATINFITQIHLERQTFCNLFQGESLNLNQIIESGIVYLQSAFHLFHSLNHHTGPLVLPPTMVFTWTSGISLSSSLALPYPALIYDIIMTVSCVAIAHSHLGKAKMEEGVWAEAGSHFKQAAWLFQVIL